MSDNSREFKQGLERGAAGKQDAQGLADIDRLFDTSADRAARERGFEAGSAARATAEAISRRTNSASSYTGGSSSNAPLFLIRRWFPNLFPWSESDAATLITNALWAVVSLSGVLTGLYVGYTTGGLGKAIFLALLFGGVGAFAGIFVGLFLPLIVVMLMNAIIIGVPIGLVLWGLSLIWIAKL